MRCTPRRILALLITITHLLAAFALLILSPVAHAAPARQSSPSATSTLYLPLVTSGRTQAVAGSLQTALDAAQPGDVLVLGNATYTGKLTIRRAGTASAPITLRGAGVGLSILSGSIRFTDKAAFWNIQDLDVDASAAQDGVRIEAPAHHIVLQRMHIYGGEGYGVRIGNDVRFVTVEDSEIDHFDAGSSDAHGIGIMTASDIVIRGNDIHHNSGDSIQSNTPDYAGYGRYASNIHIEDNDLHENRENALDIKSTHGLVAQYNRMWGFQAVDSSDGMAVQVQYDAQDITILGNEIWGAVEGIEVSRGRKNGTDYPAMPQRVTIVGNYIHGLNADSNGDSANGSGIVIRSSSAVKVYNNTVLGASSAALYLSYSSEDLLPSSIDVRNNVFEGQQADVTFATAPAGILGLIVDYNHYVNGSVKGSGITGWLTMGYEKHGTSGDPKLDARAQPQAGSPLLNSGVTLGLSFSGSAPDRGCGELRVGR